MIRGDDRSLREQIKAEVLQEVHRVLLGYEERLAQLESSRYALENQLKLAYTRIDELEDYVEAIEGDLKKEIANIA